MADDFTIPPPDFDGTDPSFAPSMQAAWTLELIRVKLDNSELPDKVKKTILIDMNALVNNASMTNIRRGQVREFLGGYNEIWMKYKIFINRREHRKELSYLESSIREIFIQNLCKSIDGFMPSLVFEQRHIYDVKQTKHDVGERMKGWFHRKPKKSKEDSE